MYILSTIAVQIKNQTPKMLISRFKFIDYTCSYFNSCSIFKTPITQIAKYLFRELAETIIQNLDMGMTSTFLWHF